MSSHDLFRFVFVFYWIGHISQASPVLAASKTPLLEIEALTIIFFETNGVHWKNNSGWDTLLPSSSYAEVSDPCVAGWYGITCFSEAGWFHVRSVVLSENNMKSSKFPSFSNLTYLDTLDLSSHEISPNQNLIVGNIDEICLLPPTIEILLLNYNSLYGNFPSCIGEKLVNLTHLNLGFNLMNGTIPDSLSLLSNSLISVNVSSSQLSGTIPTSLNQLTKLKIMSFFNNSLAFSIPSQLCNLGGLGVFELFQNSLSGTIPSCIDAWSNLTTFTVAMNKLSGPIPISFCELRKLRIFEVNENTDMSGTIPDCIGQLTNLNFFQLSANKFTGNIPTSVCNLTMLSNFCVRENRFTGTVPSCLGSMPNLREILLFYNKFSGTLPPSFCHLGRLTKLELFDNSLHGTIPSCYGNSFPSLQVMMLQHNKLQGSLPESWVLPNLLFLVLSNNVNLRGTLPDSLFHQHGSLLDDDQNVDNDYISNNFHSKLTDIVIEGTSISGSIPDSLCQADQLSTLLLSGNLISGTLPDCMVRLRYLETIRVPNNKLSGNLVHKLDNMSSLAYLDLSDNHLAGTMPSSLGAISTQLIETSLILNHMSCNLPNSVLHWKKSHHFKSLEILQGNMFSCPERGLFGLSMDSSQSKELFQAEKYSSDYSCGGSAYLIPVILPTSAMLLLCMIYYVGTRRHIGGFKKQNQDDFFRLNYRLFSETSLHEAYQEMRRLSVSIILLGLISLFFMLPLSASYVSTSYQCEYAMRFTIGGKHGNERMFSLGVGFVTSVSLLIGLRVWISYMINYRRSPIYKQIQSRRQGGGRNRQELLIDSNSLSVRTGSGLSDMFGNVHYKSYSANTLEQTLDPLRKVLLNVSDLRNTESSSEGDDSVKLHKFVPSASALRSSSSTVSLLSSAATPQAYLKETSSSSSSLPKSSSSSSSIPSSSVISSLTSASTQQASSSVEYGELPKSSKDNDLFGNVSEGDETVTLSVDSKKNGITKLERLLWLLCLVMSMTLVTIGPNVAYVFVILGTFSSSTKLICTLLISLFKVGTATVTIPKVATQLTHLLFPNNSSPNQIFRLSINIGITLAALGIVLAPIGIVMVTDERCFYYVFKPRATVTNSLSYNECFVHDAYGGCIERDTTTVYSTYSPKFHYNEGQCISAILSTYAPVFLAFILLSAPLSASLDLVIVPLVAPWCYHHRNSKSLTRHALPVLRAITWNVPSVLSSHFESQEDVNNVIEGVDIDYFAGRVIRRAYVQFCSTLLVSLTYGIAAPVIGGACMLTVFIQFRHHTLVLSQIVDLGELMPVPQIPNVSHCHSLPKFTGFAVFSTMTLFWFCAMVYYMDGGAILQVVISVFLLSIIFGTVIRCWSRKS